MNEEMKYYGKYHSFNEDEPSRKIWIGPMTEDEMKQDFEEFRHNSRSCVMVSLPEPPKGEE